MAFLVRIYVSSDETYCIQEKQRDLRPLETIVSATRALTSIRRVEVWRAPKRVRSRGGRARRPELFN